MNEQPVGQRLEQWTPPPWPVREVIPGAYCLLEPLEPERHAQDLHHAFMQAGTPLWTYLFYGPFACPTDFETWMRTYSCGADPLLFAIVDRASGVPTGMAGYMRIQPEAGSIEVGHVVFSPALQRTRAATEAMYLLMRSAFALGYRRYEWKCDALNAPSRRAALRLGFQYEGLFRQACVIRGRNRDTTWFSVIDAEWPALQAAFEQWLEPANFDAAGRQKKSLAQFRCHEEPVPQARP